MSLDDYITGRFDKSNPANYPDDYGECPCGNPADCSNGLCSDCNKEREEEMERDGVKDEN